MKSTLGEEGHRSATTHSLKNKIQEKNPKEKRVWVKGPSPTMENHVLDSIFKPRPTS